MEIVARIRRQVTILTQKKDQENVEEEKAGAWSPVTRDETLVLYLASKRRPIKRFIAPIFCFSLIYHRVRLVFISIQNGFQYFVTSPAENSFPLGSMCCNFYTREFGPTHLLGFSPRNGPLRGPFATLRARQPIAAEVPDRFWAVSPLVATTPIDHEITLPAPPFSASCFQVPATRVSANGSA